MSIEFYKVLHLFGLFLTFTALGGGLTHAANGGTAESNPSRGLLGMLHGLGLTIVLIAGFGLHAKLHVEGFPGWFLLKLALWAALGAMVLIPRRKPDLGKVALVALPAFGLLGAWLALNKPF
jgi:hypothetical protein